MKIYLILLIITFTFTYENVIGQDKRWILLTQTKDKGKVFIDTDPGDIQQKSSYNDHYSVVIVLVKTLKKVQNKNGSYDHSLVCRFAVDTTLKQLETKFLIEYKNGRVINSVTYDEIHWEDIIPDSIGEAVMRYVKTIE